MSKFQAKLDADTLIYSLGYCDSDGCTVHKLRQWRPTNDRLAPRGSDWSRMRRKVSSDWLPSYIKVTRPILEILNMARYFPDRPHTLDIKYLNKSIANSLYSTFLGLMVDDNLTWKKHIDQFISKLNSACYAIRAVNVTLSKKALRMLYFSYIHSIIS